jgi:hypothetical protein
MSVLGYVIWVWGVFPRWVGCLFFLAGLGYVSDSTLFFLMNGYDGQATAILLLPALLAEFGFTGCLLLKSRVFPVYTLEVHVRSLKIQALSMGFQWIGWFYAVECGSRQGSIKQRPLAHGGWNPVKFYHTPMIYDSNRD